MFGIRKPKILAWSVISSVLLVASCAQGVQDNSTDQRSFIEITGEAQGTTYTLILVGDDIQVEKTSIDSLFTVVDQSLSTYVESSVISSINASTDRLSIEDPSGYFEECYQLSLHVYELSNGRFDPSVFPLVKGWGFMNNIESPLAQKEVDSLLQFVSFEANELHKIAFSKDTIHISKSNPSFMIDFNAIAQGLSVDIIDRYLKGKGLTSYYIEVGGELLVRGKNRENQPWVIGIDSPVENQTTRELENVMHISDQAIATSGNYRKFYVKDGIKYAHTLDPKTGFPVQHSLLSATVVAENCALADAYATAFMVMGVEQTMQFLKEHPEEKLEVYLLYADQQGKIQRQMSDGFRPYLD